MIEPVFIESVVKVLDRLTDLLKYRQGRRKEFFNSVIEPLFNDLLTMHTDYIKMFDECRAQLADETTSLVKIEETLRLRRVVYDAVRLKCKGIVEALQGMDLEPQMAAFLKIAVSHVPSGSIADEPEDGGIHEVLRRSRMFGISNSASGMLLRMLQAADEGRLVLDPQIASFPKIQRAHLLQSATTTLSDIRQRWTLICEEYTRLKVWALH